MASLWFAPNARIQQPLLPFAASYERQRSFFKPSKCMPSPEIAQQDAEVILCEPCNGSGWLLCDFCKGQKTNVKSENKRIYRRCPSCRAVGYVLCSKCKVFKCVTFPISDDGEDFSCKDS